MANKTRAQSNAAPDEIGRMLTPSYLETPVNTTVLAGMFSPIENVSVENKILINPSCRRRRRRGRQDT